MGMLDTGMYDTVLNHYDFGAGWYKRTLHTRSINETPLMRVFFLDPAARLWLIECDGTHDFYEDQDDPNNQFKWVKNGKHGKCKPFLYSGRMRVMPEKWDAYYAPYPECNLLFRDGILEVVTHLKKLV